MSLKIEVYKKNDCTEIFPYGEIDMLTSSDFREEVHKAIDDENNIIVINAEKLEYIDSVGLGTFMSILKRVKEKNIDIKIINLRSTIKKLFDITGFSKIFNVDGN